MTMSLLDLAKLYNFSGVATVLAVSVWVATRYGSAFFRPWLGAYLAGLGLLGCELVASYLLGSPGFHAVQAALVASVIWCFAQTGRTMRGRPLGWQGGVALVAAVALGTFAWVAAGKAFLTIFGPLVLVYAGAHMWLGWQLRGDSGRFWLGWALIGSGLWFLTYPVLAASAYAWVGYLVSGLLNMAVGMGMALYLVDLTARELRASKEELVRDVDRSNTFIHTMSHELRTPLGSIKTAAFLVGRSEDHPLSPQQRELVSIIDDQSELLNRLVGDLLDHSRITSGLLTCTPEEEDLAALARRAVGAMEKALAAKGITLSLVGADRPIPLEADGARLMQVISNLLANAKKFTPKGGHVEVRVGQRGGRAFVEVQDDGIGIAPEHHERVFENYFQVDGGTKRKVGGMGLGLAIAKAIVEEGHAGTLGLRSELGEGATFIVEVPLVHAEAGMMRA
jgi:signal transduction histidine kinase